ncbi:MAG: hypothetical protein J6L87_00330 [Clostridia bacterium]|nr:hypothetical protein [Clostridia bacterium]
MEEQMMQTATPDQSYIRHFCTLPPADLMSLAAELHLSLTAEGMLFAQSYFRDAERRDPTVGELRFLDLYARVAALSPEALTLDAPRFESEDDTRIWNDLCRKAQTLALAENPISPQTVSEILSVCGKYLSRSGRSAQNESLTLLDPCTYVITEHEAPVGDEALVASPHRPEVIRPMPGLALLMLSPTGSGSFAEEIVAFLHRYPGAMQPLCYVGEEGLLPHLVHADYGLELDLVGLHSAGSDDMVSALTNATHHTLLLITHEANLPLLFSQGAPLSLLGRTQREARLLIRRGATMLASLSTDFLLRWHQKRAISPTVPAATTHTVSAPLLRVVGDTLIGTVKATGRALPAMMTLLHALFLQGARFEEMSMTAALTLPCATEKNVALALPMLLDYHRVAAELAWPATEGQVCCREQLAEPTLTIAIAVQKAALPTNEATEGLLAALSAADFGALRKILYEKL